MSKRPDQGQRWKPQYHRVCWAGLLCCLLWWASLGACTSTPAPNEAVSELVGDGGLQCQSPPDTPLSPISGQTPEAGTPEQPTDPAKFRCVRRKRFDAPSRLAVFSDDGKRLVLQNESTISFLNTATWRVRRTIKFKSSMLSIPNAISYAPKSDTLLIIEGYSSTSQIARYDLRTRRVIQRYPPICLTVAVGFQGQHNPHDAVWFSQNGKFLLAKHKRQGSYVVDVETGAFLRYLDPGKPFVRSVAYDRRRDWFATSDSDLVINIWDLRSRVPQRLLVAPNADGRYDSLSVPVLAFDPSARYLLQSNKQGLRVWDLKADKSWRLPTAEKERVSFRAERLVFHPEGKVFFTLPRENTSTIELRRFSDGRLLQKLEGRTAFYDLGVSPDGRYLIGTGQRPELWECK